MVTLKGLNLRYLFLVVVWFFSFVISCTFCQDIDSLKILRTNIDQKYGLDQNLVNGRKYIHQNPLAFGFPEWFQKKPFNGEIVISGIKYSNQSLRFNAYKQIFILNYKDYNSALKSIELNNSQVDTVKINGSVFIQNNNKDIPSAIVEIIAIDSISCFIAWRKDYSYNGGGLHPGFYYTDDIKLIYITYRDRLWLAKNKRSFLKAFSKGIRDSVRKYLSGQTNNFKEMNSHELKLLLNYCNDLLNQ
jgi:hypothetical protein